MDKVEKSAICAFTPEQLLKMQQCSFLLPDPGGEVVRKCVDEIFKLRSMLLITAESIMANIDSNDATKNSKANVEIATNIVQFMTNTYKDGECDD